MGERFEQCQQHTTDAGADMKKQADKALGFLEQLRERGEHGCERALAIIDQAASLAGGMFNITHRVYPTLREAVRVEKEIDKLVQKLLDAAAESPIDAGWAFVAFWEAMLTLKVKAKEAAAA